MQKRAAGRRGKPARRQRNKVQEGEGETARSVPHPVAHLAGASVASIRAEHPSREPLAYHRLLRCKLTEPLSGCNYDTFPFPFAADGAGRQHQTPPGSSQPTALARDFERKRSSDFAKENSLRCGDRFLRLTPPSFPYTPALTSTGAEVDIRDEGWGRWVQTSMALNPVLSWIPGFP